MTREGPLARGKPDIARISSKDRLDPNAVLWRGAFGYAHPIWGIGRAGNSLVYSEQFRSVHRTRRALYGSLNGAVNRLWRGRFNMRRREFITLLGGTAAWPFAARAQQPAMPVVGFLGTTSPESYGERLRGFRQGLRENGFVEGENIAITYRWAENRFDRLPELAADLVRHQVALIVAGGGTPAALNAKAATATIPVVFGVAQDPVRLGLVASMSRPGGNVTGVNFFNSELSAKRLELLRAVVPAASRVAVLVNPATPFNTEAQLRDVEAAARTMNLQIQVYNARTPQQTNAAFESRPRDEPEAL